MPNLPVYVRCSGGRPLLLVFAFQQTHPEKKKKKKDEAGKKVMMTKELNNGRLAMLATIGVWAQELVDGKTILGHLFG